jgi:hypothetical protein
MFFTLYKNIQLLVLKNILCFFILGCITSSVYSGSITVKPVHFYPCNNAESIHPDTDIGVTYSEALDSDLLSVDSILVIGAHNKQYKGLLKLSLDQRTLIFIPQEHFLPGDSIHVHIGSFSTMNQETSPSFTFSFLIRKEITYQVSPDMTASVTPLLPTDVPQMNVLVNTTPTDGDIYITGNNQNGPFAAITDKNGNVQKYLQANHMYNDFKPNANGTYSYFDDSKRGFIILDTNFSIIDSVVAPPEYIADNHEIRFTSEDNRIIIVNDNVITDMRKYIPNGDSTAIVADPILLLYDKGHNLLWQWRSLDHFKVTDATNEALTLPFIDYCHLNAIEFDGDSNLLLSCRNMDEITKINRKTGEIMWRWGGKNNQFQLDGDTIPFSHQHSIRRTAEGTYTMFDNGYIRVNSQPYSRAIEYRLDTATHRVTKIWEFRHTPDIFAESMGYVERLPNKGTFIAWGNNPTIAVTEVDSEKKTLFEMSLPDNSFSYRASKYDTNYIRGGLQKASVSSPLLNEEVSISVMPNPSTDNATIQFTSPSDEYAKLFLYDGVGREAAKIYSGFISHGLHEFSVNTRHLPAGAYHLRINLGSTSIEKQFIIVR